MLGSYLIIVYTLLVRPFKLSFMNDLEIFNEAIILMLTY